MSESLLTVPSFLRNTSDQQYTTHHDDDNDAKKGMIIVAIVLLFLFCIVALRHGCNLLIDVFILRDYDQSPVVRTVSKIRRWICPCWQPTTPDTGPDVEIAATNSDNNTQETVTMDMLLAGMTSKQKQQLVASIVPSKTATNQDIIIWTQQSCLEPLAERHQHCSDSDNRNSKSEPDTNKNDCCVVDQWTKNKGSDVAAENATDTHQEENDLSEQTLRVAGHGEENREQCKHQNHHQPLICPICIHEIQPGDQVCCSQFCHHVFHRDCLSAWLSTHSRICPYCRGEIITQQMLNDAHINRRCYRRRRSASALSQTTAPSSDGDGGDDDDDIEDEDDSDDDDDSSDSGEISSDSFSRYRP